MNPKDIKVGRLNERNRVLQKKLQQSGK